MLTPLQIIEKIDDFTLSSEDQSPRKWLGASEIGESCVRKLWYSFHWCGQPRFDGRMLRLLDRGDREEQQFVRILRGSGWTVFTPYNDYEDGKSFFQFKDCQEHFAGTADGGGFAPGDDEPVLLSYKTWKSETKNAPSAGFETLCRLGVKEAAPKHYSQEQSYLGELKIKRTLYCGLCKNDDRLYFEWLNYDDDHFSVCLTKAEIIINAKTPPNRISQDRNTFSCRYCHFNQLCHDNIPIIPSARHCRNCTSGMPAAGGTWECRKGHVFGTLCRDYTPVAGGDPADHPLA